MILFTSLFSESIEYASIFFLFQGVKQDLLQAEKVHQVIQILLKFIFGEEVWVLELFFASFFCCKDWKTRKKVHYFI